MAKFIELREYQQADVVINVSNVALLREEGELRNIHLNIRQDDSNIVIQTQSQIAEMKMLINTAKEDYIPLTDVEKKMYNFPANNDSNQK
jgi:hypothetical protein